MLDAVIREKTTATWEQTLPGGGLWQPRLDLGETFAFDKARMGDRHIWVDPHMPASAALVSDALFAALREANIKAIQTPPHFAEL